MFVKERDKNKPLQPIIVEEQKESDLNNGQ